MVRISRSAVDRRRWICRIRLAIRHTMQSLRQRDSGKYGSIRGHVFTVQVVLRRRWSKRRPWQAVAPHVGNEARRNINNRQSTGGRVTGAMRKTNGKREEVWDARWPLSVSELRVRPGFSATLGAPFP